MTTEVLTKHIDALGHVNNVQYLYWVQDAAHNHWEALIQNINKPLGVWVVRSHSITYKQAALMGELLLTTYVKASKGFLSERIVEIAVKQTHTLLARCSTQWCYLNKDSGKLERIPQEVLELLGS
jgi:acyl-CoA thioester hydrolase